MGPVQKTISEKLKREFDPIELDVENESHRHSVPPGSETHFKVFLVSAKFAGQARVARQRQVFSVLDSELKNGVHALSMRLLTPEEWQASGLAKAPASPDCKGGNGL